MNQNTPSVLNCTQNGVPVILSIIGQVSVNLDSSASVYYAIITPSTGVLATGTNTLTTAQYNAWGSQDDYVIQTVAANLGLIPA